MSHLLNQLEARSRIFRKQEFQVNRRVDKRLDLEKRPASDRKVMDVFGTMEPTVSLGMFATTETEARRS